MTQFAILCLIVLIIDAIGFKNYVWFFSIGYGFSIAALGIAMLALFSEGLNWLGIVYVMFGGARRIEIRQNRSYGDDSEYQKYVREVPIMIPFVPLYSVEKYKWLMA